MNEIDFLLWVKGSAFTIAVAIFIIGMLLKLFEIVSLGRKEDYAKPRGNPIKGGFHEMWRRFLPVDKQTFERSAVTVIAGYMFHIGLFVVVFFFVPHILLVDSLLGLSWPALPTPIIDAFAVITMVALIAALIHRLVHPVKRYLSTIMDYVVWTVTFLPVLTGYMAFHHLLLSNNMLIALHILSVEILLILIPFSKLSHVMTTFMARWYTGTTMGARGVKS